MCSPIGIWAGDRFLQGTLTCLTHTGLVESGTPASWAPPPARVGAVSGLCGCGRGHPLGVSLSLASLAVCIEFGISETRAPALFHPRRGNGQGPRLALQLRGGPG